MRRKERLLEDIEVIRSVLRAARTLQLALCDDVQPYVLPLSFGFAESEASWLFYFHGAREGKKIELLEKNPRAAFSLFLEFGQDYGQTDETCSYTERYASVLGQGRLRLHEARSEKRLALDCLMRHQCRTGDFASPWREISGAALDALSTFELEVRRDALSAKSNLGEGLKTALEAYMKRPFTYSLAAAAKAEL